MSGGIVLYKLRIIISYSAPFAVMTMLILVSWLFVVEKPFNLRMFGVLVFYALPVYMLCIAPCYWLLHVVSQKLQLRIVLPSLLLVFIQTMLTGWLVGVRVEGYIYLFLLFSVSIVIFLFFSSENVV